MLNWLSSASRAGPREDVWMDNHLDCAALVVNEDHVGRVRDAENVKDCSLELRELCSSSQLGQRVYGGLLSQLCFDEYLSGLDEIIAETLSGDIDEKVMASAFAKAEELANRLEYDQRCSSRACVTSSYQKMELKLGDHDSTSVASAKIMTWVKQLGVARGSIVQLWFEKDILPVAEPADENTITETITKPINTARRMVNEQAAASNVSTGDLSVKMKESHQQALEQVDASAAIEVALCRALATGPGEAKMEEELFKCLPYNARTMSLSESLAAIDWLQESALYKFCPLSAQAKLAEVLGSVKSLMRAQAPCFTSWGGNTFGKAQGSDLATLLDSPH